MVKLALNLHKLNNYAFFCPVSKVHLTVSSPVGYANEVTPAILRAVKAQTVLDVDGVINLETGTVDKGKQKQVGKPEEPKTAPTEPAEVNKVAETTPEASVDEVAKETTEEKVTKKGRKSSAKSE